MPIVKHIAIHASPKSFLKYILNGDKNSDMKYATGINSVADIEKSYKLFEGNFERNTGEKFFKYSVEKENENCKEKIRLHHYIQSFSPDEKISPEEAHRIGLEWAKKAFGSNRQIICSTHIDKKHIHNHFAVAVYNDSGVRWISNKKTLTAARKISDDISLKHGISIIDNSSKRGGVKYKEWIEKNGGSSWKEKLRRDIDKLVADESVPSIDEMMQQLSDDGYRIRNGKFISIRAPEHDRGIRIFRLGNGYSEDDIRYRLQNRDKEISVPAIMQKYKGIQIEYALCLRQVQIIVYHKQTNPKKYSVRNVQDMGNVLTHMYQQGICCRNDFNDRINKDRENYERAKAELERLEKQIASVQKTADDCAVFSAISKKIPDVTEEERQEYRRTPYCRQYDYKNILNHLSELKQKQNAVIADYESAKQQLSQSEKIAIQYDRYMADDYSKIFEQVRTERQALAEAILPKEVQRGKNIVVGYYR